MHILGGKSDISGLDIANSDIFRLQLTEIKAMIFFGHNTYQNNLSRLCRGNADLNSHCCGIFMFVFRCLSIKLVDNSGLQLSLNDIFWSSENFLDQRPPPPVCACVKRLPE